MDYRRWFWVGVLVLTGATVGHSMWATSLDSFTIDEAYHIAAGASYLRWGDFRVNPEHPPLVKLVAGLAEPERVLHLDPPQIVADKEKERVYTQTAVFLNSDSEWVRRRARAALMTFNAALLVMLGWLLRRVFGVEIALGTLLLLALDPTVSAHLPVVMTDLPLALVGTICCCLAILCVRDGGWGNWVLFGGMAGLMLATKHSAPLIGVPLVVGCAGVLGWQRWKGDRVGRQLAGLAAAVALSVVVLWGTYGFHYRESKLKDARGQSVETFNRPLDAKIGDLRSAGLREVLTVAVRSHVLPRAYLWGLADTLRAGVESRPLWVNAFGHSYQGKAPWWVLFAFLMVKLPIGFMLLALGGWGLLLAGRLEREIAVPLTAISAMAVMFMGWLAHNGVFYAGIRHFLFVVPLMAVAGGVCIAFCAGRREQWVRALPVIAVVWIAVMVLPQRRIWEYHNGLAGGSEHAWERFDNESVDLGQRSGELITFIKEHIAPAEAITVYGVSTEQMEAAGLKEWEPKPEDVASGNITGWICQRAPSLPVRDWYLTPALRGVKPTVRFGDLLIFHGTFYMPKRAAGLLSFHAMKMLYRENGDKREAERYLLQSIKLNPKSMSVAVELGNFAVERKDREKALEWYRLAWEDAKTAPDAQADIGRQIEGAKVLPEAELKPMRNPNRE